MFSFFTCCTFLISGNVPQIWTGPGVLEGPCAGYRCSDGIHASKGTLRKDSCFFEETGFKKCFWITRNEHQNIRCKRETIYSSKINAACSLILKSLTLLFQENVNLIAEINALRKELKTAQHHISNMEAVLGISCRYMTPKKARHQLQMAIKGNEEIQNEYKRKLEVSLYVACRMISKE